jgi:site-specific DNA-methyltransferase (adenine-specific)
MDLKHRQTIILGDCKEVLKTFENECIDVVVTSPPYNIGIKYNSYEDKKENYLEWLYEIFSEVKRVLAKDGSFFLNIGSINSNPWISFDVAQKLRDIFVLQNHIIWCKSISITENQSYGQYKPVISERFLNHTYENIFHFTKTGNVKLYRKAIGVPYVHKINLTFPTVTEDCRCRGNVWFIPYETIQTKKDRGNHPAVFPRKLVEMCLKLHGFNENTIVCDPFLGTGTTLVVCNELGCKGVGIEIDKKYYDYSIERLGKTSSRI